MLPTLQEEQAQLRRRARATLFDLVRVVDNDMNDVPMFQVEPVASDGRFGVA